MGEFRLAERLQQERKAAVDAYWAAETAAAERAAYQRMLSAGLPDGYAGPEVESAERGKPRVRLRYDVMADKLVYEVRAPGKVRIGDDDLTLRPGQRLEMRWVYDFGGRGHEPATTYEFDIVHG